MGRRDLLHKVSIPHPAALKLTCKCRSFLTLWIFVMGKDGGQRKKARGLDHMHVKQLVSSVTQSCLTLQPHGLLHSRPPCPSPTPRAYSNPCPLSRWCHSTISSSVISFSSCLQSFPASGSFQMSQLFASGGQSIGVSALASVLPIDIQGWFPLGWTGWISLQSNGLSRIFSNTTVQKHQLFSTQLSL